MKVNPWEFLPFREKSSLHCSLDPCKINIIMLIGTLRCREEKYPCFLCQESAVGRVAYIMSSTILISMTNTRCKQTYCYKIPI